MGFNFNWREHYNSRQTTFEEVAKMVKPHDVITVGFGPCGCSNEMYEAILDRAPELEDVWIIDALQVRPGTRLYDPEFMKTVDGHVNYRPMFGGGLIRKMMYSRQADFFGGAASTGRRRMGQVANMFIHACTPPNEAGYVNLGIACFYTKGGIAMGRKLGNLRTVVAEINDQMPTVWGDNWMHVSEFDYFIEKSQPITIVKRGEPGEAESIIGKYCTELINDRDTIQMGIGGVPEAVVANLEGKHDLGVITEMFPAGLKGLVEKGIVTNKYKPFHQGVTIASFVTGDQEMYSYMDSNPTCQFYPIEYTNNPFFIAQHPNMKTINGAMAIDLFAQTASEGMGPLTLTGCGGQPDFALGAFNSEGGEGITVIKSGRRMPDGSFRSAIVPMLPQGTPVTLPRWLTDTVITEYGIARHLRDKSTRQRAKALIEIAHPDVRAELTAAMHKYVLPW